MQPLPVAQPIFLVGAERSGTTLLRIMLDHHPQQAWCHEFEYAVDLLDESGGFPPLEVYHDWLETNRIFQEADFEIDPQLDYCQLVNSFLRQRQNKEQKEFVGATVHRRFDQLVGIWSQAKFIHITRDGRDVARSCIGMGWAGNVWTGIERWIEVEHLWRSFSSSLAPEQKIEVTYESLISQPESTLTALCDFIGVGFDPQMLTYDQTTSYDLPNPQLVQQWRHKLSPIEIQLVESRISDMLVARGYKLSGIPLMRVSWIMKQQLKLQDWYQRVWFRIKRFGFTLFLADNLSRRLKINPWQKKIQLKMNAIQQSYLK